MVQQALIDDRRELTIPIKGRRDPLDRYYTPPPYVRPLTCTLGRRLKGTRAWEPCAGGGSIVRELQPWCSSVWASDLDPDAAADAVYVDFLQAESDDAPDFDWIITNPPYRNVAAYVRRALQLSRRVAMLLRLTFLEGCGDREDILSQTPLSDLIIVGRIPFEGPAGELAKKTDQSSDQVPHAWLVWDEFAEHSNTRHHYFNVKEAA